MLEVFQRGRLVVRISTAARAAKASGSHGERTVSIRMPASTGKSSDRIKPLVTLPGSFSSLGCRLLTRSWDVWINLGI